MVVCLIKYIQLLYIPTIIQQEGLLLIYAQHNELEMDSFHHKKDITILLNESLLNNKDLILLSIYMLIIHILLKLNFQYP